MRKEETVPNLNGELNSTELCSVVGASCPWIKKVQRLLGLKGGSGIKGKTSWYSPEDVKVYKEVRLLRLIGFTFPEIQQLLEIKAGGGCGPCSPYTISVETAIKKRAKEIEELRKGVLDNA